jgi:HPt (histidine-containing phosphotransfer) domain-containing protein
MSWRLPDHLAELGEMGGDDVLQEILAIFLEDTPDRLARIAAAIDRADPVEVSREGHGLKSGCLQIGADDLARLAAELEHGAPPAHWPELLYRLTIAYDTLAAQLRAYCASSGSGTTR